MNKTKKLLGAGLVVSAGVLIAASTAFACTTFLGQWKVTGNGTGSGTVVATGDPSGTMKYKSISAENAKVKGSSGSLTLSVNADPANANNKLPRNRSDGSLIDYYVMWDDYTSTSDGDFSTHTTMKYDCMYGQQPNMQYFGPVNISSSGSGGPWTANTRTTSNRTPKNSSGVYYNEAAVCISDKGYNWGNQAPVTII